MDTKVGGGSIQCNVSVVCAVGTASCGISAEIVQFAALQLSGLRLQQTLSGTCKAIRFVRTEPVVESAKTNDRFEIWHPIIWTHMLTLMSAGVNFP